jgi:hypothetical protein
MGTSGEDISEVDSRDNLERKSDLQSGYSHPDFQTPGNGIIVHEDVHSQQQADPDN